MPAMNFSRQLFTPHWDTLKPWKVSRVGLATPAGGPTANFSWQISAHTSRDWISDT